MDNENYQGDEMQPLEPKIEITFKDVELTRLTLQPGQILMVKIYMDDLSQSAVAMLKTQLQSCFPDNRIMLFALPEGGRMEMDVLDTSLPDMSLKTPVCSNCSCGKKAMQEG
jgi:hypothetical protein